MKDIFLSSMSGVLNAVVLKEPDRVFTLSVGRRGMEEARVFITMKGQFKAEALAPASQFFLGNGMERVGGESAQDIFLGRERPSLFEEVEPIDEDFGVDFSLLG